MREAEARVTLADARVDQARREGSVDVSLLGTYMRMDAGFPQQGVGATGALERVRGRFNYVAGGQWSQVQDVRVIVTERASTRSGLRCDQARLHG